MLGYDTAEIREFWGHASKVLGVSDDTPYCAYTFAEPNDDADVIAEIDALSGLALAGLKRGTAHMKIQFANDNIPMRSIGDYWVVLKCDGSPVCVVKIIGIDIVPFNEVGPVFAASEGEGDMTLDFWRKGHGEYFEEQCERWGEGFRDDYPVVCESFILVYRPSERA